MIPKVNSCHTSKLLVTTDHGKIRSPSRAIIASFSSLNSWLELKRRRLGRKMAVASCISGLAMTGFVVILITINPRCFGSHFIKAQRSANVAYENCPCILQNACQKFHGQRFRITRRNVPCQEYGTIPCCGFSGLSKTNVGLETTEDDMSEAESASESRIVMPPGPMSMKGRRQKFDSLLKFPGTDLLEKLALPSRVNSVTEDVSIPLESLFKSLNNESLSPNQTSRKQKAIQKTSEGTGEKGQGTGVSSGNNRTAYFGVKQTLLRPGITSSTESPSAPKSKSGLKPPPVSPSLSNFVPKGANVSKKLSSEGIPILPNSPPSKALNSTANVTEINVSRGSVTTLTSSTGRREGTPQNLSVTFRKILPFSYPRNVPLLRNTSSISEPSKSTSSSSSPLIPVDSRKPIMTSLSIIHKVQGSRPSPLSTPVIQPGRFTTRHRESSDDKITTAVPASTYRFRSMRRRLPNIENRPESSSILPLTDPTESILIIPGNSGKEESLSTEYASVYRHPPLFKQRKRLRPRFKFSTTTSSPTTFGTPKIASEKESSPEDEGSHHGAYDLEATNEDPTNSGESPGTEDKFLHSIPESGSMTPSEKVPVVEVIESVEVQPTTFIPQSPMVLEGGLHGHDKGAAERGESTQNMTILGEESLYAVTELPHVQVTLTPSNPMLTADKEPSPKKALEIRRGHPKSNEKMNRIAISPPLPTNSENYSRIRMGPTKEKPKASYGMGISDTKRLAIKEPIFQAATTILDHLHPESSYYSQQVSETDDKGMHSVIQTVRAPNLRDLEALFKGKSNLILDKEGRKYMRVPSPQQSASNGNPSSYTASSRPPPPALPSLSEEGKTLPVSPSPSPYHYTLDKFENPSDSGREIENESRIHPTFIRKVNKVTRGSSSGPGKSSEEDGTPLSVPKDPGVSRGSLSHRGSFKPGRRRRRYRKKIRVLHTTTTSTRELLPTTATTPTTTPATGIPAVSLAPMLEEEPRRETLPLSNAPTPATQGQSYYSLAIDIDHYDHFQPMNSLSPNPFTIVSPPSSPGTVPKGKQVEQMTGIPPDTVPLLVSTPKSKFVLSPYKTFITSGLSPNNVQIPVKASNVSVKGDSPGWTASVFVVPLGYGEKKNVHVDLSTPGRSSPSFESNFPRPPDTRSVTRKVSRSPVVTGNALQAYEIMHRQVTTSTTPTEDMNSDKSNPILPPNAAGPSLASSVRQEQIKQEPFGMGVIPPSSSSEGHGEVKSSSATGRKPLGNEGPSSEFLWESRRKSNTKRRFSVPQTFTLPTRSNVATDSKAPNATSLQYEDQKPGKYKQHNGVPIPEIQQQNLPLSALPPPTVIPQRFPPPTGGNREENVNQFRYGQQITSYGEKGPGGGIRSNMVSNDHFVGNYVENPTVVDYMIREGKKEGNEAINKLLETPSAFSAPRYPGILQEAPGSHSMGSNPISPSSPNPLSIPPHVSHVNRFTHEGCQDGKHEEIEQGAGRKTLTETQFIPPTRPSPHPPPLPTSVVGNSKAVETMVEEMKSPTRSPFGNRPNGFSISIALLPGGNIIYHHSSQQPFSNGDGGVGGAPAQSIPQSSSMNFIRSEQRQVPGLSGPHTHLTPRQSDPTDANNNNSHNGILSADPFSPPPPPSILHPPQHVMETVQPNESPHPHQQHLQLIASTPTQLSIINNVPEFPGSNQAFYHSAPQQSQLSSVNSQPPANHFRIPSSNSVAYSGEISLQTHDMVGSPNSRPGPSLPSIVYQQGPQMYTQQVNNYAPPRYTPTLAPIPQQHLLISQDIIRRMKDSMRTSRSSDFSSTLEPDAFNHTHSESNHKTSSGNWTEKSTHSHTADGLSVEIKGEAKVGRNVSQDSFDPDRETEGGENSDVTTEREILDQSESRDPSDVKEPLATSYFKVTMGQVSPNSLEKAPGNISVGLFKEPTAIERGFIPVQPYSDVDPGPILVKIPNKTSEFQESAQTTFKLTASDAKMA